MPTVSPELEIAAREEILRIVQAARESRPGVSLRTACTECGYPVATISRWLRAQAEHGRDGLRPRLQNCGRKPKFTLTHDEARALRALRLQRGSLALAMEEFPAHPACQPATRAAILTELDQAAFHRRMPRWPLSVRRAAWVTEEEHASVRSDKALQVVEHCDRRDMTMVLPCGTRVPIGPNTIWESDDMSSNEPFRYTDPDTGKIQLGRQTLCTIDVFSAAWLGASPIGRERDAYRVEDIADHITSTITAYGLPIVWRFERGVWENTYIDGIKLPDGTFWGGLDALFHIKHEHKSKGKGLIEESFDLLQNLTAHQSTSIGRYRGEFQRQTRAYLRAKDGDSRAQSAFWEIAAYADGLRTAMSRFNARPKQRRAHGRATVVPDDLYRDAPRRELPSSEAWRLLPIKKTAIVRGGHIEIMAPHYPLPFRFRVNGEPGGPYLEHGYSVLIAFHPGRPEEGCHIFNAETGPRNRDGLRHGEKILLAPLAADAPQVTLGQHEREATARRNAAAAVRSEFRAIARAGGLPITARISTGTSRDGWGNRADRTNFPGGGNQRGGEQATAPRRAPRPEPTAIDLDRLRQDEDEILRREGILTT